MRIWPSRSAPALPSVPELRVMAPRNRFLAPSNSRFYTKVCISSASLLTDARLNSVLSSRDGACHPPRKLDSRLVTTRRTRALPLSPNHAPNAPSTPKRGSTPREAPSAKLHRPSALRPFPSIWRACFGSRPDWLWSRYGLGRVLERRRRAPWGRGIALCRDRRTEHCRSIV